MTTKEVIGYTADRVKALKDRLTVVETALYGVATKQHIDDGRYQGPCETLCHEFADMPASNSCQADIKKRFNQMLISAKATIDAAVNLARKGDSVQ